MTAAELKNRAASAAARGPSHIAIIGSGSASFACAIRAAERGARVTIIEQGTLGGTCVNTGCVPSKILIRAAGIAHSAHSHPFQGVETRYAQVDRRRLVAQQQARVAELRREKYQHVLEGNPAIHLLRGRARFKSARLLAVQPADGDERELLADQILIVIRV